MFDNSFNAVQGSNWRRQWHPTPVLLAGKSHGRRGLVDCSPWGRQELDTTERLHFHFSLSCIGEGKGNPLQCSCLENPRDGGARWAAIYGVSQSRTRLKRLSSISSSSRNLIITIAIITIIVTIVTIIVSVRRSVREFHEEVITKWILENNILSKEKRSVKSYFTVE